MLVVRLVGEVCTWSTRQIEPMLRTVITSHDPGAIGVDLSAVTFFNRARSEPARRREAMGR